MVSLRVRGLDVRVRTDEPAAQVGRCVDGEPGEGSLLAVLIEAAAAHGVHIGCFMLLAVETGLARLDIGSGTCAGGVMVTVPPCQLSDTTFALLFGEQGGNAGFHAGTGIVAAILLGANYFPGAKRGGF